MNKQYQNLDIIQEFQEYHDIKNGYGNSYFNAIISFTVNGWKGTHESQVLISTNNYQDEGKVSVLKSELDPTVYPTVFNPHYDTYSITNDNALKIDGFHTRNPQIGQYTVVIKPLV